MAVTIGSNIASIGAQRQLSRNSSELSAVYERLSSGQRINRASDDAAGLAIADSLRNDARVRTVAVRNLNDGLSATNIVSSALTSQNQILTRLAELSEQSSNGTFTDTQRQAMNTEYKALRDEMARIGKTTTFNGVNLLDSSASNFNSTLHLQAGVEGDINSILSLNSDHAASYGGTMVYEDLAHFSDTLIAEFGHLKYSFEDLYSRFGGNFQELNVRDTNGNNRTILLAIGSFGSNSVTFLAFDRALSDEGKPITQSMWGNEIDASYIDAAIANSMAFDPSTGKVSGSFDLNTALAGASSFTVDPRDAGISVTGLTISSRGGTTPAPNLGQSSVVEFTTLMTQGSSRTALDRVKNRIEQVAQQLGKIGAYQSRITTAISNLQISRENTLAAEERIRAADIASESSALVRAQILQQASAAVLGQANQSPALALSLLKI